MVLRTQLKVVCSEQAKLREAAATSHGPFGAEGLVTGVLLYSVAGTE